MRVAIVHYHLESGGVTRVIELSSLALTVAGVRHVILTGDASSQPSPLPVCHVPDLGYLATPGETTAGDLLNSLRAAAALALDGPPDVWHFHNHSLGKNRLLPEVVARLAAEGERITLQIHDLAENGRPQNYPLIANCSHLYPVSPTIHYAFLNSRDRGIFTAAGLPRSNSSILANPVVSRPEPATPTAPPGEASILFAPIRGIRRKNLGELILLAALAPEGSYFAVSRAPLNPAALPVHDTWRDFARKHRLPVEFDVVDRFSPAPGAAADFGSWIAHATHFVTTSVEEGFALPFLEAIAWGKPLIGRELPHLSADHDIRHPHLYQQILIPVDWVDLTILESHLSTTLERNHRLYGRTLTNSHIAHVLDHLVQQGEIDFGNLPEPLQQGVIEKIAGFSNRCVPLVRIAGTNLPLEDWLAEIIPDRQATPADLSAYSVSSYQESLLSIYQTIVRRPSAPVGFLSPADILSAHLTPESFHFLLSAPEPVRPPVKFRAVVFDIYGTLLIAPSGGVKPDPAADPLLRAVLIEFGHRAPESPSSELHAAMLRHHAATDAEFPEVDLRVLWREALSLDPDTDTAPLVEAIEAVWHPTRPMPGAEKVVQRLARSGLSLGLLSNAQSNSLQSLGGLADLFAPELTILSYQHGVAKPSPRLFLSLADRLAGRGITPAETLYVGNDPLQDIAPARAAGFHTALFTGHPDSLRPGDCTPDVTVANWQEFVRHF